MDGPPLPAPALQYGTSWLGARSCARMEPPARANAATGKIISRALEEWPWQLTIQHASAFSNAFAPDCGCPYRKRRMLQLALSSTQSKILLNSSTRNPNPPAHSAHPC